MKKFLGPVGMILAGITLFGTVACSGGSTAPAPDSDSAQQYNANAKIEVDTNIYNITGTVTAQVQSLTRQRSPGGGSVGGSLFGTNGFAYGSIGGSFFGPVQTGRGFVRITVDKAEPATDLAGVGETVILKVSDTKGTALLPGDTVTFRCRRQYEAVAAVKNNQKFDVRTDGTWELDYCRLATPVITVGKN